MRTLRRRRERGPAEGFTLIEMMVALGILAFGLLAIFAMQIHALQQGRFGRHTTEAARVAQQRMERLHRLDWGDTELQATGAWTTANTVDVNVDTTSTTVVEQSYDVQHRVTAINTNLRQIDVRVQWTEGDGTQRRYAASTVRHNDP